MRADPLLNFPGPSRRAYGGRISPHVALALVVATGFLWSTTTRPLESMRVLARSPDAPLTLERWALLYSSVFGGVVLVAGLVASAVYLAHVRRRSATPDAWPRLYASVHDDDGSTTILVQRLHADIATCEARFRIARRSDDPREIARAVVSGRHALDEILAELEAAGVCVDEIGAD